MSHPVQVWLVITCIGVGVANTVDLRVVLVVVLATISVCIASSDVGKYLHCVVHVCCLQRTYAEANNGFYDNSSSRDKGSNPSKDDRIHGSLLIINELIMNAAWSDEVRWHCTY